MQFAAEKSEAEAKIKVARLNAKYAAALNGATIGVQKTLVNGDTIYALRVTGLSKADAAALCDRLKGRELLYRQVRAFHRTLKKLVIPSDQFAAVDQRRGLKSRLWPTTAQQLEAHAGHAVS